MDVSRETTGINVGAAILDALTPKPTERSVRYAKRLDDQLATLPDDATKHAFLKQQREHWFELYRRWALAVDLGKIELKDDGPTAFDFLMTISDIGARMARYEGREQAVAS